MDDLISRAAAIDALCKDSCGSEWCGVSCQEVVVIETLPSVQPEETCDTCKHGYFGDGKCDYCRERFPSHYERRTDEPDE